jgi:hypothetical protein
MDERGSSEAADEAEEREREEQGAYEDSLPIG